MKSFTLIPMLLASIVGADLLLITPRESLSLLSRDTKCPVASCASDNGDTICIAADEYCCQLAVGTNPYSCPPTHPFCCPADTTTGNLLCGTDAACSGPIQNLPKGNGRGGMGGKEGMMAAVVAIAAAIL
ncbi:hypothetical protein B0O99DRAFT_718819 [Bisporella sp. PMI_857]|nr:hypothetical protein B0O99DRAFT_718819 [Bisporella sp. PMI_857]